MTSRITQSLWPINRIILGAIFIYASWDKVLDPAAFAQVIANYQLLPPSMVAITAVCLPWLELVCGVCLVINRWSSGSALIVTILVTVFMGTLGFNIYRGMDVSCGCFTMDNQAPQNMWLYMLRDAVFLSMSIGALYYALKGRKPAVSA